MKQSIFSIIVLTIIVSCSNPVENANKIFAEQGDSIIGKDITYLNSTMDFLYYANPCNYWYPEKYTFRDILDDKYKLGYDGLSKLDERINAIITEDPIISKAISELEKQIIIAQKNIKKKQSSIEHLNNMFGMMTYGGLSGLMDFGGALSTSEDRQELDEKGRKMPVNVNIAFNKLVACLFVKYYTVAGNINNLETKAFMRPKPNNEQKSKIRYNLKLFVRNKINQQYNAKDTVSRDEMVKRLFDYYERKYSLTK